MNSRPANPLFDPVRLNDVYRLNQLDTPPEEAFDRLTRLAGRLLSVPIALVSLVDDKRQFFKSACGLPEPLATSRQTPLSHSFCQHVVASGLPLVVEDARQHAVVRDNAAVTAYNVIAYLGVPLTTQNGTTLGSFCVIDSRPRFWSAADRETMTELAASVMSEFALRLACDELHGANRNLRREAGEREHLLRTLQDREAMLRAAQRLARVGSFVLHEQTAAARTHFSDEARRIFDLPASIPPAGVAGFVDNLVYADDRPRVAAALRRALKLKQPCEIEHRLYRPDGEIRTLLTAIEPELGGDGEASVLCTTLDITERRRVEAKLAEYRSELWHVARVATAGEMAAMMAHEVNQPLAAIALTADACARLNAAGSIERDTFAGHLSDIHSQAKRASGIIRRIRDFVRKRPIAYRTLDLDRVVDDILCMLSPIANQLHIKIERVTGSAVLRIKGDEIQLGQLVLNLVRNALDAVSRNRSCGRHVVVSTSRDDNARIILDVIDNGPGIRPEARAKLFEPFFTTRRNGLGMGLPIARTIAEAHHGEMSALDRVDGARGAHFRVVFPAASRRSGGHHGKHGLSDRR
jgi:signal transduction histidine kinase